MNHSSRTRLIFFSRLATTFSCTGSKTATTTGQRSPEACRGNAAFFTGGTTCTTVGARKVFVSSVATATKAWQLAIDGQVPTERTEKPGTTSWAYVKNAEGRPAYTTVLATLPAKGLAWPVCFVVKGQ